jgi:hypothetical protein
MALVSDANVRRRISAGALQSIRQEGWMQAIVLGGIVKTKLSAFRIALIFASAGAFLLLIAAALSYSL